MSIVPAIKSVTNDDSFLLSNTLMGAFFSPLNIVLLFSISFFFFFPANIFRVKKLKETFAFIQQLDKNMSNLRTWLARIESELSKPVVYDVCDDQEIQKRLAEQQVGKCGMGFFLGPLTQTCLTLAVCSSGFTSMVLVCFLQRKLTTCLCPWGCEASVSYTHTPPYMCLLVKYFE